MSDCRAVEPLLAERASGPLAPADEARAAAHLAGCASCRAEAGRLSELFDLVRAPAAGDAEERGAAVLPGRILAAARRPARAPLLPWAAGIAAAALLALLLPAALNTGRRPAAHPPSSPAPQAAEAAAWEEPDAEALWELADAALPLDEDID